MDCGYDRRHIQLNQIVKGLETLIPQVHDVSVGTEPGVIGEVPAGVVGIGIDYDVVVIPQPSVCIVVVIGRHLEKVAVDIKSIAVTAAKPPDVLRPDTAAEASVFPWVIEMIVGIVGSGVVSHPLICFGVDVRGLGMVWLIAEGAPLILLRRSGTAIGLTRRMCGFTATLRSTTGRGCRLRGSMNRSGAVRRNMTTANAAITATLSWLLAMLLWLLPALLFRLRGLLVAPVPLGESGNREKQRHCEESDECFHVDLNFLSEDQSAPYPHPLSSCTGWG